MEVSKEDRYLIDNIKSENKEVFVRLDRNHIWSHTCYKTGELSFVEFFAPNFLNFVSKNNGDGDMFLDLSHFELSQIDYCYLDGNLNISIYSKGDIIRNPHNRIIFMCLKMTQLMAKIIMKWIIEKKAGNDFSVEDIYKFYFKK